MVINDIIQSIEEESKKEINEEIKNINLETSDIFLF